MTGSTSSQHNRILQSRLDWARSRVANAGGHGAAELMLKPFTMRFCSTACAEANAPDIIDITCLLASVSVACPRRTVRMLVQWMVWPPVLTAVLCERCSELHELVSGRGPLVL